MPAPLKRLLVLAACVLIAWYAHRPLLGAGFLGSDAHVLDEIDRAFGEDRADAPWSVAEINHRPVAAFSLALSRSLHTRGGVYTPGDAGRLRLEGLLILVLAAFGVRAAVIRALRAWTGEDHARAAGAASGALLMVHPLLVPVVAHLPARGDVVALAASAWSVALLLRGRQERSTVALGAAFVLALVAAASSPAALALVPLGFGLEFIAARRHRPLASKVKTAVVVALGYTAALGCEAAIRHFVAQSASVDGGVLRRTPAELLRGDGTSLVRALGEAAEKTGVVVLPVNTTAVGALGYALAALALLFALHPGFVAARAAPRLWGRVLGGWAIALTVLLIIGAGERANPASLSDAPDTLSLAVCMAVGLGISASALSGARRTVLPFLAGGIYALLTAASGSTIQEAAAEVGALHQGILDAHAYYAEDGEGALEGPVQSMWILDPPREVAGVEALAPRHDISLASAPFLPPGAQTVEVRGVPAASFWAITGTPEFEAARRLGLLLLLPPQKKSSTDQGPVLVDRGPDGAMVGPETDSTRQWRIAADVTRRAIRLRSPDDLTTIAASLGPDGEFGWGSEGASPAARYFDPFEAVAVTASAPPSVDGSEWVVPDSELEPTVRWTGTSWLAIDGVRRGVWLQTEDGPEAVFALSESPSWLAAGLIRSVWFTGSLRRASAVRVTAAPRPIPGDVRPEVNGEDWVFDVSGAADLQPIAPAREAWILWVVDRRSGAYVRLVPTLAATGRLVAEGAGVFHDEDVLWILDRTLDGVTVQRARGQRSR